MKVCGMKAYGRWSSHGCPSKCQSMGNRTCHYHAPASAPSLHLGRTIACLKAEELVVLFVAQLEQQQQNTATTTKWQLHELFKPPPFCWSSTCDCRESCSWFSAGPSPARPNSSSSRRVPCGQRSKCFGFLPEASLLRLVICQRFVDSLRTWGWPDLVYSSSVEQDQAMSGQTKPRHVVLYVGLLLTC